MAHSFLLMLLMFIQRRSKKLKVCDVEGEDE
jgi:hypothetical protein